MKPHQNLHLNDMKGEVWKDVQGYDGKYIVSNLGRVKSFARNRTQIMKWNTGHVNNNPTVTMILNNIKKSISVAKLVGLHFVGTPDYSKNQCFCKIKKDPLDCRADNLMIESRSYSTYESYDQGKMKASNIHLHRPALRFVYIGTAEDGREIPHTLKQLREKYGENGKRQIQSAIYDKRTKSRFFGQTWRKEPINLWGNLKLHHLQSALYSTAIEEKPESP